MIKMWVMPTARLSASSKALESMTVKDVVDCLSRLGLTQYAATFQSECVCLSLIRDDYDDGVQVDGPLFKKLDDEMLEKDLKVTSKLHRTKLLLHIQHRIEGRSVVNTHACGVAEHLKCA